MAKSVKDTKTNDTIKPTRKVGRPCVYTPEALEVKFEEYANWTKNNPIIKQVPTKHGLVDLELQRPKTIVGFCVYAGILRDTFFDYGKREEFFYIIARVREEIEADQLSGAIAGIYDSGVITRVLKLADKQDITTNGESINKPRETVQVILDPEAASIIQSIGKQSTNENGA